MKFIHFDLLARLAVVGLYTGIEMYLMIRGLHERTEHQLCREQSTSSF